jgi:hypothetical protein
VPSSVIMSRLAATLKHALRAQSDHETDSEMDPVEYGDSDFPETSSSDSDASTDAKAAKLRVSKGGLYPPGYFYRRTIIFLKRKRAQAEQELVDVKRQLAKVKRELAKVCAAKGRVPTKVAKCKRSE